MSMIETKQDLLKDLLIAQDEPIKLLDVLVNSDHRYVRDLRINLKNTINSENLELKESYLIALAIAVNEKNSVLIESFSKLAEDNDASPEEISDIISCASLLATNNVFYRFRHFADKESYNNKPAGIKMNIMMKPVVGKEFFELVSLAVSAVNGCEMCVKSHEASLMKLGSNEDRVFDAIKLASIIKGLSSVLK